MFVSYKIVDYIYDFHMAPPTRVVATRAIHLTSQDAPSGPLLPYIIGNHAQYHTLTIFASGSTAT